MQLAGDPLQALLGGQGSLMEQLQATEARGAPHSGASSGARSSLEFSGSAHAAAAAAAAAAAQHHAQLAGCDVPMLLEDLLPLEDLHDPFLELEHPDLAAAVAAAAPPVRAAMPAEHPPAAAAVQHLHICAHPRLDPSEPVCADGGAIDPFTPTPTGFFGIPAYAEPDSPAAALLNNMAGGHGFPLHHPCSAAAEPAAALPAAILAAQQHVVQQLQMQAATAAAAQQAVPTALANPAADRVGSGAGASHMSNGSNGSAAPTAARLYSLGRASADSSGSDPSQLEDACQLDDYQTEDAARTARPAGPGGAPLTFTAGVAPPPPGGNPAPAKRGGRPREKKSYDDQIDPSLPADEIRRLRRMLSNRESARRSRRRRQTQMSSLEVELEQLKSEKGDLESRLNQASSVVQQMAAEKAAMLAEIERLRMQVAAVATVAPLAPGAAPPPLAKRLPPLAKRLPPLAEPASCDGAGAGRLPPLIEQAQRMAAKLTQPRGSGELPAAGM